MANNVSLYTLGTQYQALMDKLAEGDFDAATIADTLESTGIEDALADKVEGYEMVARNIEQFTPAIDAEIARLQALKQKRTLAAAALRQRVLKTFLESGIQKVQTPRFTVSVRDNPESVDVFDERMVPFEFRRPPPLSMPPDKTAIKAELKAGRDVPGAKLARSSRLVVQ